MNMLNNFGVADSYFNKALFSLGVLIAILVTSYFIRKSIDILLGKIRGNKLRTIRSLLKNIVDVVLIFMGVMVIMSKWGINVGPILTGAGILGLAFSFGAQTLVKDLIAGFFIIVENQFNVGDRVKIDKYEGEVWKITLRLTVLKDSIGNLIYIPNSQITTVIRLKSN